MKIIVFAAILSVAFCLPRPQSKEALPVEQVADSEGKDVLKILWPYTILKNNREFVADSVI